MRRLRELWPLPAMFGMLFFLAVLVSFRPAFPQSMSAGMDLRQAVVDIGPTTNNGPGDQTKGILNWSASPIKLVNASGPGKYYDVVHWHIQYKKGTVDYADPSFASFGPFVLGASEAFPSAGGLAVWAAGITAVDAGMNGLAYFDLSLPSGFSDVPIADNSSGGAPRTSVDNTAIWFGDSSGFVRELTTGDGSVRITVQYTIEKIL